MTTCKQHAIFLLKSIIIENNKGLDIEKIRHQHIVESYKIIYEKYGIYFYIYKHKLYIDNHAASQLLLSCTNLMVELNGTRIFNNYWIAPKNKRFIKEINKKLQMQHKIQDEIIQMQKMQIDSEQMQKKMQIDSEQMQEKMQIDSEQMQEKMQINSEQMQEKMQINSEQMQEKMHDEQMQENMQVDSDQDEIIRPLKRKTTFIINEDKILKKRKLIKVDEDEEILFIEKQKFIPCSFTTFEINGERRSMRNLKNTRVYTE
jgi:hypothetical protein